MKNAIIHISDLHVCLHEDLKGNQPKNGVPSWLTTDPNGDSKEYIEAFCSYIRNKYSNHAFSLLITGDIANVSDEAEYKYASIYLNSIISNLRIEKERTLILPGDHDINRDSNRAAHRAGRTIYTTKQSYEYEEKYEFFSSFYKSFYGREFAPNKAIIDLVSFEKEKLLLIGINSNFQIDYDGGAGFVNVEKLREELRDAQVKYNEFSKIACFHHNIFSAYENKATGQWDVKNRKNIIALLNEFGIKCILYGNEHTRDSKYSGSSKEDHMYRSDSGCFASRTGVSPSFKIYELEFTSTRLALKNNLFVIQSANKIDEFTFGKWAIQNNDDLSEIKEFVLKEAQLITVEEDNTLDNLASQGNNSLARSHNVEEAPTQMGHIYISYSNTFYRDKLFQLVKVKKLFHSGHFHWSETSRAHNWIDISKILNNKDDLYDAKNAIIDVIEHCGLSNKFDFIIGLGIEGNILSSRASVKYNKPYSFLPYSYRYEEHNSYEKRLNFANEGQYKSVLIITDVVNDGRTLRKLINKREPSFFEKVERIIVVSLFYTGQHASQAPDILNTKGQKYDTENDHAEDRIEYYYVLDMKVEKCPYGANYRSECLLVREGLGCIHNFYDDKKALEKRKKVEASSVYSHISS